MSEKWIVFFGDFVFMRLDIGLIGLWLSVGKFVSLPLLLSYHMHPSSPRYTWIGQSAPVNAIQVPIPATSLVSLYPS